MKGSQIIGMLGVCLFSVTLSAYQVGEPGIFAFISKGAEAMCQRSTHRQDNQTMVQEKNAHGKKSNVTIINGFAQFNRQVIEASLFKPVVVKVHSIHSADSQKMRQPFQEVSEKFKNMVSFASLDLFRQHAGQQENYELIEKLMTSLGVSRIDLPLILFFRKGTLYSPAHLPGSMLQGFYSRDDLSNIIQKKFFQPQAMITGRPQTVRPHSSPVKRMSLTTTTTSGSRLPPKQGVEKKERKSSVSWWKRFKGMFKKSK